MFSKIVWLTPTLKDKFVQNSIVRHKEKSLVVIGTADPHFVDERISELKRNDIFSYYIENGDHGLDIERDVEKSILEMKNIVHSISNFLLS